MGKRERETISLVEPEPEPAAPGSEPAAPDPPPPVDEVVDDGFIHIKLNKPIQVFADQISELKLRKPTGADLIRIGNPVLLLDPFSESIQVDHDMPKMAKMIARLANVPTISIDLLATDDLLRIVWAVTPFFIPWARTI